ncbi:MAG: hypothetical protein AABY22_36560 [Nanoarchaeota archaeon]
MILKEKLNMNTNPLMYVVEMTDRYPAYKIYFLASCFEENNKESLNTAILQLVTNLDKMSVDKNEPITSRSAINVIEPKNFPSSQGVFDHNQYSATENTRILVKAYLQKGEDDAESFYGIISFDESGKFYLTLPKETDDLVAYDGTSFTPTTPSE